MKASKCGHSLRLQIQRRSNGGGGGRRLEVRLALVLRKMMELSGTKPITVGVPWYTVIVARRGHSLPGGGDGL